MSSSFITVNEGWLFLSAVFSSIFWGIGTAQTYLYYEAHTGTDGMWMKCYVALAWVLDTIHEILLLQAVYVYLVKDIGNVDALSKSSSPFAATTLLVCLLDLQVQLLYTLRIWKLSALSGRNVVLIGTFLVIMMIQFVAGIVSYTELSAIDDHLNTGYMTIPWKSLSINLAAGAVVDTALVVTIVILLRRMSSDNELQSSRTTSLVNRIVRYMISTGLITAVLAITSLITCITIRSSFIFVISTELYPKVFFNCMLSLLNARPLSSERAREYVFKEDSAGQEHTISTRTQDISSLNPMVFEIGLNSDIEANAIKPSSA